MEYLQNIIEFKRNVFLLCCEKGNMLIKKGLQFSFNDMPKCLREELAVNARYLHRGFYCPSLVRDTIIGNARRGRILKNPRKQTSYSHRYYFGQDNKLLMAESVLGDQKKKLEYLIYEGDTVFGIAFDPWGSLVGLSEEVYENNRLKTYYCASCYISPKDHIDCGITEIFYEEYGCDDLGLQNVTLYHISPYIDRFDDDDEVDSLVGCSRYRFIRENGMLLGLYSADSDDASLEDAAFIERFSVPKEA